MGVSHIRTFISSIVMRHWHAWHELRIPGVGLQYSRLLLLGHLGKLILFPPRRGGVGWGGVVVVSNPTNKNMFNPYMALLMVT